MSCQETHQHEKQDSEKSATQSLTEENHAAHQKMGDKDQKGTKASPHKMAMDNIGTAHVHIEYNSPSVRNRIIWGGLVALGEVWVTGAHNATSVSFSEDVKIEGKTIPKGKYAFFTIPNQEEWTLILNKNWNQHLADDYTEKDDILRWKVKPKALTEPVEQLTYQVKVIDNKTGMVEMAWEKLSIQFEISQ